MKTPVPIEYTFRARVISIEEKFTRTNYRRVVDPETGQISWDHDATSIGWFIRYTESSAIRVGSVRPDFSVGDDIEIVLRRPRSF